MASDDGTAGMTRRQALALGGAGIAALAGCTSTPMQAQREWDVQPVEHDRRIGAQYYPWYGATADWVNWVERKAPVEPELGSYDSSDLDVVNQHIQWALEHGINWFSVSWTGHPDVADAGNPHGFPDDRNMDSHHDAWLQGPFQDADLGSEIDFTISYESKGRLDGWDLSDPANREVLRRDFAYMDDEYFGMDNYLTIDGRPVVFIYHSYSFEGDVQGAFQEAKSEASHDPYLLADRLAGDTAEQPWIGEFDGATAYTYKSRDLPEDMTIHEFADYVEEQMDREYAAAKDADLDFVPNAMPGFKAKNKPWLDPIPRTPDGFRDYCTVTRDHMDPDAQAALITSFNEWPEFTAIEPAETYGTTYLDIVKDELATAAPAYAE